VTSGTKTIFEAEFTDAEISAANFKTLLAAVLSVDPSTITAAIRETTQGIRLTYTESAEAKIQVDIFGYSARGTGRPTKAASNIVALAYMGSTWGGGTLVSGIPRVYPDFTKDVDEWWEVHPLNPVAPYPLDITHPTTSIDVEVDFAGDLQAAIDSTDANGATIVLGAVYYNDNFDIIAKRNLHFIGQAGTKVKTFHIFPEGTFGISYPEWTTALHLDTDPNHDAAHAIIADLPCNFYFSDITFDGNNEPFTQPTIGYLDGLAVQVNASRDVLFDRCVFEKYGELDGNHGTVCGGAYIYNVFFRDCTFYPPGYVASYLDGLHGGGYVNCDFIGRYKAYTLLFLTNNDFTLDYDFDGVLTDDDLRNSTYVIVDACTYDWTGDGADAFINCMGEHLLVRDCTVTNTLGSMIYLTSFAATDTRKAYEFTDIQFTGNVIADCFYLLKMNATGGLSSVPPRIAGTLGGAVLTGNHALVLREGAWIKEVGTMTPANYIADDNVVGA
jgi:hypothetical protein